MLKPKKGAPSSYSDELGEEICKDIATTPMMLEELCKLKPNWPCAQTIYEWRVKYKHFGEMFAIAKQCQVEVLVSRMFELCRTSDDDFYEDGTKKAPNSSALSRRKSEMDNIKWFAARLAPRIYGEKVEVKTVKDAISEFRVEDDSK